MDVLNVILIVMGIGYLLLGIIFLFIEKTFAPPANVWKRTTGEVIKRKKGSKKVSNSRNLLSMLPDQKSTFQYVVNGEKYEKTSRISQRPSLAPGKVVDVIYDPDNPNLAVIDSFVQKGTIFKLMGFIFLSAFCFCIFISLFFIFT